MSKSSEKSEKQEQSQAKAKKPVFVLPSKNKEYRDPVTGRMSVVKPE